MIGVDKNRSTGPSRVGFVGLGIMGRPMALNLLRAGFDLTVASRSPDSVAELVGAGATASSSAGELAARCDVVITMLPDTPDVLSVALDPGGILDRSFPGSLLIDMSTISPIAARELGAACREREIGFVDAPVSGGERGAMEGALSIMVGGDAGDLDRAMPVFEVLGKSTTHVGGVGAGQVAKAANQLIVAMNIQAVAEALKLAESMGVDPGKVMEAIGGGFAGSRVLDVHGPRIAGASFDPGFRVKLHLKDARIIQELASVTGLGPMVFDGVVERLAQLVEAGLGDLDHSALALTVGDSSRFGQSRGQGPEEE